MNQKETESCEYCKSKKHSLKTNKKHICNCGKDTNKKIKEER